MIHEDTRPLSAIVRETVLLLNDDRLHIIEVWKHDTPNKKTVVFSCSDSNDDWCRTDLRQVHSCPGKYF